MSEAGPRQFFWRGVRVPFIAPWSSEARIHAPLVRLPNLPGGGIGYAGESPRVDRRDGILWVRMPAVRGVGEPRLAGVHALRQRQAMTHLLCQVCGTSTYPRQDERHLFLMGERNGRPIVEGERTAVPPVHEECAAEALRDCPHLRCGAVAARVAYPSPWGVAGILHHPRTLAALPAPTNEDLDFVPHGHPDLRWIIAARDVVTLHGCTPVSLDEIMSLSA
ncbi:hypothetical protein ACIPSA_43065 [Streptomyces sp. NPDC086549]|uniref:hypothetical protein n=1 Tax=Streptomyces sp. NPDC086549 TaxID=3365752 RepID=UPI00381DE8FF